MQMSSLCDRITGGFIFVLIVMGAVVTKGLADFNGSHIYER